MDNPNAAVADAAAKTTEALNRTVENMKQAAETLAEAGRVYLDGVQTISTGIAQAAQKQMDETLAAFRAVAGVKSAREAFELQVKLARTGAQRLLTEGATVAEQSAKLAVDVIKPVTERVRAAAEKLAA